LLADGITHIELKNIPYTANSTPSTQAIVQVIGQNGAFGNISRLSEFEWVAFANRGNTTTDLKIMWKNVLYNSTGNNLTTRGQQAFDTIWGNMNLRNDIFGAGISRSDAQLDFVDLITELDNPNVTNPKLYSFIKSE